MRNSEVSYLVFQALSHPCRRAVVEMLADEREATVGQISQRFEMTRPAVAKHLARLRVANLVSESWRGREHVYQSKPETLRVVLEWLGRVGATASTASRERIEGERALQRQQASRSHPLDGVFDRSGMPQDALPRSDAGSQVEDLDREVASGSAEVGEVETADAETAASEAGEVQAGGVQAGEVQAGEIEAGEIEWQVW